MSSKVVMPDFYFVTPHGTGSLSLAYYLRLMGVGLFRQGTAQKIQEQIAGQTCSIGLNIDNSSPSTENEKACTGQALPTIWLVRDPIELLCSNCNFNISSNILRCSVWFQRLPAKFLIPELLLEHLIMGDISSFYCHYSSQLLKVKPSSLLCLDTSELSSEHIEKSLQSIWALIGKERDLQLDMSLVGKNFNSFESRLQIFFSYLALDGFPGISIHIYSKEYFDYIQYVKMWAENIFLFDIYDVDVDGKKYTLALQCDNAEYVKKASESIIKQLENYLPEYIRMRNGYLENVASTLQAFKITPQRVLEMLDADKKLKRAFLRSQRDELKLVKKFRPDLVERWTSFAQIGVDIW